jgi:hypothetical protein
MPFLIRIILQRLLAGLLGLLTFLGISINTGIPTKEEAEFRLTEQKEIVENILNIKNSDEESESIISAIDTADKKIDSKKESYQT